MFGAEKLQKIIKSKTQLEPVLQALPKTDRAAFLDLLGKDIIRDIILNLPMFLKEILDALPETNRAAFLELLGKKKIQDIIQSASSPSDCNIAFHALLLMQSGKDPVKMQNPEKLKDAFIKFVDALKTDNEKIEYLNKIKEPNNNALAMLFNSSNKSALSQVQGLFSSTKQSIADEILNHNHFKDLLEPIAKIDETQSKKP